MNRLESLAAHEPLFAKTRGDIHVSFEFFPPKTESMSETLWQSIKTLEPLHPRFVSVTYGAGGSTRERTHATVERIVNETALTAAAHLTCVAATREEIDEVNAGDIAAAVGLKDTYTGDTLADPDHPVVLESMTFPEPVIEVKIEPKTKADQDKLAIALQRLSDGSGLVHGCVKTYTAV